jgi:hypothetical protein
MAGERVVGLTLEALHRVGAGPLRTLHPQDVCLDGLRCVRQMSNVGKVSAAGLLPGTRSVRSQFGESHGSLECAAGVVRPGTFKLRPLHRAWKGRVVPWP